MQKLPVELLKSNISYFPSSILLIRPKRTYHKVSVCCALDQNHLLIFIMDSHNLVPFVNLTDYPERREIILNIVGNSTMFIPVGIVWPSLFPQLRKVRSGLAAGVGFSLAIEILQLPFFDRVTDIDDLILNSLGYAVGYGIWLFSRFLGRKLCKSAAIQ